MYWYFEVLGIFGVGFFLGFWGLFFLVFSSILRLTRSRLAIFWGRVCCMYGEGLVRLPVCLSVCLSLGLLSCTLCRVESHVVFTPMGYWAKVLALTLWWLSIVGLTFSLQLASQGNRGSFLVYYFGWTSYVVARLALLYGRSGERRSSDVPSGLLSFSGCISFACHVHASVCILRAVNMLPNLL